MVVGRHLRHHKWLPTSRSISVIREAGAGVITILDDVDLGGAAVRGVVQPVSEWREVKGKKVASLEAMLLVGVFEDPEVVVEGGSKGVVPTLDACEGLWWNFYAVVFKPDW
ncbi:hypothetical protein L1887_24598 [Cichorium endivia]|nr:hypothetical protein L1887_24598 [Cichorium endivia]